MNLKFVHIGFISVCFILGIGMIVWGAQGYRLEKDATDLSLIIIGALLLLVLPFYGRWFWKEVRNMPAVAFVVVTVTAWMLSPNVSWACAVCFKDPENDLVKGAKAGVLVLAGIIYALLMGVAGIAFTWVRRARALSNQ